MSRKFLISFAKVLAAALFWILVWYGVAALVAKELLLPSPSAVISRLAAIVSEKDFYVTTIYSLLRVLSGIVIACAVSVLLAVLTHISKPAYILARPLITVIKATPVASFIILALVWLDRGILPVFISLLMVLPVIWTNVSTGLSEVDPKLLDLAKVFKIKWSQRLKGIYVPSVLPYFTSAAKTSLGLAWKAGIAAEVLAAPARSIGKELLDSKAYFETADLFAWTVVVIVLSLIIELVFEVFISKLLSGRRKPDA